MTRYKVCSARAICILIIAVAFASTNLFGQTPTPAEANLPQAAAWHAEASKFNDSGKYTDALPLGVRALETREKLLGFRHADTLDSLFLLVRIHAGKNDLAKSEALLQRVMEALSAANETESLGYASATYYLARLRVLQGRQAEAERLYEQTIAIRTKLTGADSIPTAAALHNLALLQRTQGNYPRAEENFSKALAIHEKTLGENHLETANVLNSFGLFFYGKGDQVRAAGLLERALAIREKLLPPNHFAIGVSLNNLGLVEVRRRQWDKARAYYQRALGIFEIATGPESDGVASISMNLSAIFRQADGDLAKAEEYTKRALAIHEKIFGENHQATITAVSILGVIYRDMGDNERAEKFLLRSLEGNKRLLGDYNQLTLQNIGHLVRTYAAAGDVGRAVQFTSDLAALYEKVLPLNLSIGSEREKIAYYEQASRIDSMLTLHSGLAKNDGAMRDLAATAVLRHKGRVLDAVAENLTSLRQRFSEQDRKLLDELNDVNTKLSKAIIGGRQKLSVEDHRKQVKSLEDERERLESEIGRRSAGFYRPTREVTLDAVRQMIPAGSALVEYAVYKPQVWNRASSNEPEPPRYIVYVIRREGDVLWKDLGESKPVDDAIAEFRKALADPKRADVKRLARSVDEKVMQPVRELIGGRQTHLLISPDGELNVVPFEAMADEKGRYLIENWSFTYLTSGRDLLPQARERTDKQVPLIVANPSFGETSALAAQKSAADTTRSSVTAASNLDETYFAPLIGTAEEAKIVLDALPDARLISGAEANERSLRQVVAPRVLHIATHGFFLENRKDAASGPAQNPLLRSGIALAGANRRDNTKEDGVLTALEASGLNLWGTELVVLSACDTGLGDIKNGEGVYGLRRAFTLAGAQSLVMSLWAVSDYSTRELMSGFYKNLKLGRANALRHAQLDVRKREGRSHPFHWAAFVQTGRPLDIKKVR